MADQQPGQPQQAKDPTPMPGTFPDRTFPTIFADTVWSLTRYPGVVKFFLTRSDPSYSGDSSSQINHVAQVVMPFTGFVAMTAFFEVTVKNMVASGEVTQEIVDHWRAAMSGSQHA